MKRRLTAVAAVIWALVLVAVASSTITMMATGGVGNASGRAITDEEQAILDRYSRLEDVRKTITDQYYEEVDQDTLVQGAIDGMLASLDDPYTFYYTVDDMAAREESTYGNYKGVGMSVQMDGEGAINVVRVFANSPAEKAGVLSGDKLIAIDGVTLNIQNYKDLDEAWRTRKSPCPSCGTASLWSCRLPAATCRSITWNISSSTISDMCGFTNSNPPLPRISLRRWTISRSRRFPAW